MSFSFFFIYSNLALSAAFIAFYFLARSISSFSFFMNYRLSFSSLLQTPRIFPLSYYCFSYMMRCWVCISSSIRPIFFFSMSSCSPHCFSTLFLSCCSTSKKAVSLDLSCTISAWYSNSFFFKY